MKYLGITLIFLAALWLFTRLLPVLQPVLWGVVLAYLIYPAVMFLTAKKVPLSLSILLIYLLIGIIVALGVIWGVPLLIEELELFLGILPQYIALGKSWFLALLEKLPVGLFPEGFQTMIQQLYGNVETMLIGAVRQGVENLPVMVSNVFTAALSPVFAYYFIKERAAISKQLRAYLPPKWRQKSFCLCDEVNLLLRQFLQGYLMVSLLVGILSVVGYSLVGMDYALALGVLAGLLDLIPYFGPFIGAVPAVLLSLAAGERMFFSVVLVCLAVQQIENLASPKIIGEKIGLHPIVILLSVLIGGYWWGMVGMILAMPAFAVGRKIFSILYGERVAYEHYVSEQEITDTQF